MTDYYEQKNNGDSLNQSESDDAYWLENKIKEQLEHVSSDDNVVLEGSPILGHHSIQSEESDRLFEGFGTPFFNPPNINSLIENPTLPPGLVPTDQGFSREYFVRNKMETQEQPLFQFPDTLDAKGLFNVPQREMPKHSRFSHCEPEPVKASLKSRLKLQSAQFKPEHDAAPQEEHQNEEIGENEEDEGDSEIEDQENKIASKEILGETPENKEKNEQVENNPYAGKILSQREIEERRRKKAEAEAAAKKPKASEVVIVHTKPTDETPQIEHKTELSHEAKGSKNILETPKISQNKSPKAIIKQEPQQTKPAPHHHENNGVAKQQSFKKEDSFKQATKHKKRLSVHQEKEIAEYVEKKNPLPVSKPKEDVETKPKLAGVNKFNKFEYLIGNQSSASSESNDSIDENLEVNEVKKGSNSPKKPESKSIIPEKDNDQQGSNKKKNKKKKNKNKTLTSNKDLDATPSNLAAASKEVKIPSDEGQEPSDEEAEKQQTKMSSKTAKNKKKKANKKKKKNASSIQALEIIKTPESALSQISEIEQETLSQNAKKKTFREVCEDPTMVSSGLLFIPGSNFYDDLLKGMKVVS